MAGEFGALLKEWRGLRRMSQLDLGARAEVSARHISFLETGRARPSREMVLHLGEVLEVPRTHRNRMLEAAGFASAFRSRTQQSDEMEAARRAAEWMIERHQPYPALIIDRHWKLVGANPTATTMLAGYGLAEGDSLLDAFVDSALRSSIDNWSEFGRHLLTRLRFESAAVGGDPVLDAAVRKLAADPALANGEHTLTLPAFGPTRYLVGEQVVSFLSTLAHFSGAEDIALADLRIELLFPADETTRQMLEAWART